MSTLKSPGAVSDYNRAKSDAITALWKMRIAMKQMGDEHVNFHTHIDDVQKQIKHKKEVNGVEELHVEILRSIALDPYLSADNLPKVTAIGHFELERAMKDFRSREKVLDEIQKKTTMLVDSLLGGRRCKCGDGHGA